MKKILLRAVKIFCVLLLLLAAFAGFVWVQGIQYSLALVTNSWNNPYFDSGAIRGEQNCHAAESCGSGPIRVLTYNVLCRACTSGSSKPEYENWYARLPHLQELTREYAPDLVGNQEIGGWKDINEINPDPALFAPVAHEFGPWVYGDAVLFYRTDRFDLIDSGQFWLSPKPHLPMGFGFITLSVPRYISWAHLRQKDNGFEFLFLNTHFDNNGPNKEPSAVLVNRVFGEHVSRLPVIFTGDFNTTHDTERYRNLLYGDDDAPEFVNSADLAPQMEEFPRNSPLTPAETGEIRDNLDHLIDHILLGGHFGKTVHRWVVDRRGYGPLNMPRSDHPAVFAEVEFTVRP